MLRNQKGFTLIEGLLVTIVVLLIGFTGFYVYKANKDDKKTAESNSQTTKQASQEPKDAQPTDVTQGWKAFSSAEEKFSLKYPPTWVEPNNAANCGGAFFRGASEIGRGACQSDGGPQIQVLSVDGDQSASLAPSTDYSKDIHADDVMVSGVTGQKFVSVANGDFLIQAGTKSTQYIFYTNGRTYTALYSDGAGKFKDAEADFNLMVTKTLQFKP